MAQVERYVRLSVSGLLHEDDEYIVGLAFEPGEVLSELRAALRELVESSVSAAVSEAEGYVDEEVPLDADVAEALHGLVDDRWPGRAHFIEVQHDSDDGWVQVFQPYDLPVRPELQPPPPTKTSYSLAPWHTAPVA